MARSPFDHDNFKDDRDAVRVLNSFFCGKFPLKELRYASLHGVKKNAYGEALLFSKLLQLNAPGLPEDWRSFAPFGEGTPPLELLMERPGTVVQFPTCSEENVVLWRMYLIRKEKNDFQHTDHRAFLAGNAIIGEKVWIFISSDFSPPETLEGNSWHLAYKLASRGVNLAPEYNAKLYSKLITGAVENGNVTSVCIGHKADFLNRFSGFFIIPEADAGQFHANSQLLPVKTVEQAWRLITGTGVEKTPITLPEKIEILDILVGKSWKPVFSVILLLAPAYVRLWCSAETKSDAEKIRSAFEKIKGLQIRFAVRTMDSHDLQQSYEDFCATLNDDPSSGGHLICNTGGNRLMGTAALLAARERNIQVVYRDIDAEPDYLTVIQFGKENNYESDDIQVNNCPLKDDINWETLFTSPRPFPSPEVEDILSQIMKVPSNE
ncbi:MAG: hypothetical protein IJW17_10485 [Lentisphaeria bacterium]|nr:hypothetical protein [Lentisphaeria bacterium]